MIFSDCLFTPSIAISIAKIRSVLKPKIENKTSTTLTVLINFDPVIGFDGLNNDVIFLRVEKERKITKLQIEPTI